MITYDMNLFASSDHVQKRLVEMVRFLYIADTDNWRIAMHQHEEFCEWEYVVSGRGTYVIDSRIYPIQAGDLILINCGTGHEEKSEPTDPLISWKATCRMGPQGDLPANVILPSGIEPVIHSGETGREVEECCENIRYELDKKESGYETMVMLLMERYYLLVTRIIERNGLAMEERSLSLAMQVKQYIDIHYAEKITLDILSEKLHANKYYISHEMKEEYQISPIEYLINRRLGEAQNLLNTTELPISEISKKAGYENVFYFNTLFSKRAGVSPTEFRKRTLRVYSQDN